MCLSLPVWGGQGVIRVVEKGYLERVAEVMEEMFLLLKFGGLVEGPGFETLWSCVLTKS